MTACRTFSTILIMTGAVVGLGFPGSILAQSILDAAYVQMRLEVAADSGKSVPLTPYLATMVAGADEAGVLSGQAFPLRTKLRRGVLDVEGRQVFEAHLMGYPIFVLGADRDSARWLLANRTRLRAMGALGLVVEVGSASAFKRLQAIGAGLPLVPDGSPWLTDRILAAGIETYPLLINEDGRAIQIISSSEGQERAKAPEASQ